MFLGEAATECLWSSKRCFPGRAFEAMSPSAAVIDGQIDIKGTYTITFSARDQISLAPEGHRHTAFTGALLSAAADTSRTLDQLYGKVDQILHQNRQPRPQRRTSTSPASVCSPHPNPDISTTDAAPSSDASYRYYGQYSFESDEVRYVAGVEREIIDRSDRRDHQI